MEEEFEVLLEVSKTVDEELETIEEGSKKILSRWEKTWGTGWEICGEEFEG